ncbi:hypothetical protein [Providencia rettgeri]|uniref:hypothetical protein n=1 Tax=Providencia rettgeri TaxID=587 RepID=UPI0011DDF9C0|nr:hypothetical protein [Providencia rettgeri]QXA57398.1 hypothetical protein I6L79_18860 [Providencia rettgeri]
MFLPFHDGQSLLHRFSLCPIFLRRFGDSFLWVDKKSALAEQRSQGKLDDKPVAITTTHCGATYACFSILESE